MPNGAMPNERQVRRRGRHLQWCCETTMPCLLQAAAVLKVNTQICRMITGHMLNNQETPTVQQVGSDSDRRCHRASRMACVLGGKNRKMLGKHCLDCFLSSREKVGKPLHRNARMGGRQGRRHRAGIGILTRPSSALQARLWGAAKISCRTFFLDGGASCRDER